MDETVQKIELYKRISLKKAEIGIIVEEKNITTEEELVALPQFAELQKLEKEFKDLYQ